MKKVLKFILKIFRGIYFFSNAMFLIFHMILYKYHRNNYLILEDLNRYKLKRKIRLDGILLFIHCMIYIKYFRNIFYYRIKPYDKLINFIFKEDKTLIIRAKEIKGGLYFDHPFSTILNAQYIGSNCLIRHSTTLGNKNYDPEQTPIIKDNVDIGAGVIIIGKIIIGNNCVIGAGSVVTKDVPDNCIVVGNPGRIIYKEGVRV